MGLYTEQSNYIILGKKGSGKSALGWITAETIHKLKDKKVYTFRYPRPELLKKIPFKVENVIRFDMLFNLKNAILICDEAHKYFSPAEKKVDNKTRVLLSDSRQNDLDIIFICHNSYFLNRSLFTFIDVRMIKEVNEGHWELERTHMKKLYEGVAIYGKENFFLDSDWQRGKARFDKPEWFTDEFSNAFSIQDKPLNPFEEALKNAQKVHQGATKPDSVRTNAKSPENKKK